ncbi:MAG: glycoside hydrolase [bacterium]
MSVKAPINVVLLWHMHQPEYRNLQTGEYTLPWTYLHAIKDYTDMAWHLEDKPRARAVVNFAPVLLDQLNDYAEQISRWSEKGHPVSDPLLYALVSDEQIALLGTQRIIEACSRVNEERLVERFAPLKRLSTLAKDYLTNPDSLCYLNKRFFSDLVVWYHLAWMGETIRRENLVVRRLIEKEQGFSLDDRKALMAVIGDLMGNIIPRYRRLQDEGKVELSMSPYAHPILPLLIDLDSAREAMPEAVIPERKYPDGTARSLWHIRKGKETFKRYFGKEPTGCWPSEGGVSEAALEQLGEANFQWVATGQQVLENSLARLQNQGVLAEAECRHRPYALTERVSPQVFFRDDGLSDLIGFNYATWHADDAAGDLLNHLHSIQEQCTEPGNSTVSIILDGENAWEYYPENAWYFLDALYKRLGDDSRINLTTFEALSDAAQQSRALNTLVAGSWVYGTFSTWIADPDKNRGWEYLCNAKEVYDSLPEERKNDPELLNQLAICEGSDWFWWFGDYNPSESVSDFDVLYRKNLKNLYSLMQKDAPAYLEESISRGNEEASMETGGVMRRGS